MRPAAAAASRGVSLLECTMAMAVAAVLLAAGARVGHATASLVREVGSLAETVHVARNLLEHELGSPCAAFDCPAGYRCDLERTPVTATADRVTAMASREDGGGSERLRTLAPRPACGG